MWKFSIRFLSCCCHILLSFSVGTHGICRTNVVKIKKFENLNIDELNCLLNISSRFPWRSLRLLSSEFLSWENLNTKLFLRKRHSWENLKRRKVKIHEKIFRNERKIIWDKKKTKIVENIEKKRSCIFFWASLFTKWWNRNREWLNPNNKISRKINRWIFHNLNSKNNDADSIEFHESIIDFVDYFTSKFFSIDVKYLFFDTKFDWFVCQPFIHDVSYLSKTSIEFFFVKNISCLITFKLRFWKYWYVWSPMFRRIVAKTIFVLKTVIRTFLIMSSTKE